MTEFETSRDGERLSTRYPAGYFERMRDFARQGRIERDYGARMVGERLGSDRRRP